MRGQLGAKSGQLIFLYSHKQTTQHNINARYLGKCCNLKDLNSPKPHQKAEFLYAKAWSCLVSSKKKPAYGQKLPSSWVFVNPL